MMHDSKSRSWQQIVTYIIITVLLLYLLFKYYVPVTLGFDAEDIATLLIPGSVVLIGAQAILGPTLLTRYYLGPIAIFLLWAFTYPLLFHASYTKPFYFYEFAPDYIFALGCFVVTLFWPALLGAWRNVSYYHILSRIANILLTTVTFILLAIPSAQLAYFAYIGHCITPATLMALYLSNPSESYEYVLNGIGLKGIIIALLIAIAFLLLLYRLYSDIPKILASYRSVPHPRWTYTVILLCSLLATLYYMPQTNIIKDWLGVREYMIQLQQYKDMHKEIFSSVHLTNQETAAQKTPGTVILVIGESASRTYMRVFNPNAPYPNTPWESHERESNPNFFFFNHAYAAYVQTVPVLERALTERNQYEDLPFLQAASILDIAKKAGYTTYWFSNQGVYGEYDTAISLVAKTADHAQWAHETFGFSDKYDGALLDLLQQVDPTQNNFIVLHLMGSHIYYNDRYPSEFSTFKKSNPPTGIEAYSNSILYTDHVLQEVFEYGQAHWPLQAMIYFSDHGESMTSSHNPDIFNFDMTRIPLWIYLSPTYQQAYPQTTQVLRSHENQYFTNDLLYDLVSGILQAPSNHYNPTRDFSNPAYRFQRNTLTTLLGTHKLSEDTNEE